MTAGLALGAPARAGRYPGATIAFRTARRAVRSGVLWGYIFGITVAASELGYNSTYKTRAERAHVAALFSNNAGPGRPCRPGTRLADGGGLRRVEDAGLHGGRVGRLGPAHRDQAAAGGGGRGPLGAPPRRADDPPGCLRTGPCRHRCGTGYLLGAGRGDHNCCRPVLEGQHLGAGTPCTSPSPSPPRRWSSPPPGPWPASWRPPGARRPLTPLSPLGRRTPSGWSPTPAGAWRGCAGSRPWDGPRSSSRSPTRGLWPSCPSAPQSSCWSP